MADIDVSELVDQWGAQYVNEGQTMKDIRKALFTPERAFGFFKKRPTKNTLVKSTYNSIEDIGQAFGIDFHPKGGMKFAPWETKIGEFKIDDTLTPDKVRDSYVGFLAELEKPARKDWGMIKYYIKELAIPKVKEEINDGVAYRGWKFTGEAASPSVTPATFTRELSTSAEQRMLNGAMDGVWVQICKMVAESRANVINTGALETDAKLFYEQVNDWVMSIERTYRKKLTKVFMDEDKYILYKDGSDIVNNTYYAAEADRTKIKHAPNVHVEWFDGMEGSDKLWTAFDDSMIRYVHQENTGKFDVQPEKRKVNILSDWKEQIFLDTPELVFTNDQENTITAQDTYDYYGVEDPGV